MSSPSITPIEYTYKKPDSEVWVLNTDDLPLDKSQINDIQLVHLAPGSIGGNHKHSRTEWFVGIGELLFVWLDDAGVKQERAINPDGKLLLIEVPPYLPHAVVNASLDHGAVLYEMADNKMSGAKVVQVV